MDNYEAIAYGCVAVRKLKKENTEITEKSLKSELIYLMDMYSSNEIYKRYQSEQ